MELNKDGIYPNTAFHCETEDELIDLFKQLNEIGYKCQRNYRDNTDGGDYVLDINRWKEDYSETYYVPFLEMYCPIDFLTFHKYSIIECGNRMTVKDIEEGYLLELRDGSIFMCYRPFNVGDSDDFMLGYDLNGDILAFSYNYDDNFRLINKQLSNRDIMKIYGRTSINPLESNFDTKPRKLLWERTNSVRQPYKIKARELYAKIGRNIEIIY